MVLSFLPGRAHLGCLEPLWCVCGSPFSGSGLLRLTLAVMAATGRCRSSLGGFLVCLHHQQGHSEGMPVPPGRLICSCTAAVHAALICLCRHKGGLSAGAGAPLSCGWACCSHLSHRHRGNLGRSAACALAWSPAASALPTKEVQHGKCLETWSRVAAMSSYAFLQQQNSRHQVHGEDLLNGCCCICSTHSWTVERSSAYLTKASHSARSTGCCRAVKVLGMAPTERSQA